MRCGEVVSGIGAGVTLHEIIRSSRRSRRVYDLAWRRALNPFTSGLLAAELAEGRPSTSRAVASGVLPNALMIHCERKCRCERNSRTSRRRGLRSTCVSRHRRPMADRRRVDGVRPLIPMPRSAASSSTSDCSTILATAKTGVATGATSCSIVGPKTAPCSCKANRGRTISAEALNVNATWDAIATELITAVGDVSQEGSTVLFMAQMADPNEVAAEVSRIFCGVQISCAQCHDHQDRPLEAGAVSRVGGVLSAHRGTARSLKTATNAASPSTVAISVRASAGGGDANNPRFRPIEHYMPDLNDPSARKARSCSRCSS
jgi:hypothetical protein